MPGGMFTPHFNAFRFYDDDAGEATSAPLEAQDTDHSITVDANQAFQFRARIDETGNVDGSTMDDYAVEYNKNGAGFVALTTTDSGDGIRAVAAGLTNDGATTNRTADPISDPGSGSFVAGEQSDDGIVDDRQLTNGNFTHHVYGVEFVEANVADTDTFDFRFSNSSVSANNVTPRMTIVKTVSGAITATVPMVIGAPTVDLEGKGKLDATVALIIGAPSVDLEGDGKLDALVQMAMGAPVVDLKGDGKLDATVPMVIGAPVVDLKGDGKLDAIVPMVIGAPVVNLTDATPPLGEMTATVPMVIGAPTVDLEGDGKLDATVALAFAKSSADLEGNGKLNALVQMVIGAPSVDLEGKGKLDAFVQMLFGAPSVDLKGNGKLDATVPMVFGAPVVNLTDVSGGAMSATAPMAFSKVLANLIDATPPISGPRAGRHIGPCILDFVS